MNCKHKLNIVKYRNVWISWDGVIQCERLWPDNVWRVELKFMPDNLAVDFLKKYAEKRLHLKRIINDT